MNQTKTKEEQSDIAASNLSALTAAASALSSAHAMTHVMTRATPTNRQASSSVAPDSNTHGELCHLSSPHDNDDAGVDLDPPSTQTKGGKLDTATANATDECQGKLT